MKRHHVPMGTRTTVGGEVVSASSTRSVNGSMLAVEGDQVHCPACKTVGIIRCQGPRLMDTWNGVNFALEHDLCICGCKTPPTLLAGQSLVFQTVDGRAFLSQIAVPQVFDQQFRLKDKNGSPLRGVYYTAKLPGTELIHGMTDDGGLTERFLTDSVQEIQIYLGHRRGI